MGTHYPPQTLFVGTLTKFIIVIEKSEGRGEQRRSQEFLQTIFKI